MKKFLLRIIKKYKENDFPWTTRELSFLKNEDLAEIAVATVNKKLSIVLGKGQDYSDKSDIKCIVNSFRNNIKHSARTKKAQWTNSYFIPGLKGKTGSIRVVAYNTQLDNFEFFYFPHADIAGKKFIEMVLERYSLEPGAAPPKFTGKKPKNMKSKWIDKNRVKSFEEMALASH